MGPLGIGFFEDLDLFLFEVFGEEGGETGIGVGCKVFADGTVAVEDCEEGVVWDVGEWMDGAVGILIGFVRVIWVITPLRTIRILNMNHPRAICPLQRNRLGLG